MRRKSAIQIKNMYFVVKPGAKNREKTPFPEFGRVVTPVNSRSVSSKKTRKKDNGSISVNECCLRSEPSFTLAFFKSMN